MSFACFLFCCALSFFTLIRWGIYDSVYGEETKRKMFVVACYATYFSICFWGFFLLLLWWGL